ncbi:hypothetical protein ACFW0I_33345 [[Kitasatospora] papulosa]|uniref:DNA polymerase III subunit beta family protein n=1 Tax=[Kitasatospora] papulosa TaxID=1464011 RepID=UPI0036CA337B
MPITTLDIHEFTHPPEAVPAMATMDAQTFLAQLNRVLPTAGRDETLPTLTGVQMTLEGETLTMAATDRYRFAVAEVPTSATVKPLQKPLTTLIPAGILAPLAKRLKSHEGPIGIGIIENSKGVIARATLSMGDTTITIRPLEGSLPKHDSLFPTECDTSVSVDRATVVRAAKKCQALIKAKGENGMPVSFAWTPTEPSPSPRASAPSTTRPVPRAWPLRPRSPTEAPTPFRATCSPSTPPSSWTRSAPSPATPSPCTSAR